MSIFIFDLCCFANNILRYNCKCYNPFRHFSRRQLTEHMIGGSTSSSSGIPLPVGDSRSHALPSSLVAPLQHISHSPRLNASVTPSRRVTPDTSVQMGGAYRLRDRPLGLNNGGGVRGEVDPPLKRSRLGSPLKPSSTSALALGRVSSQN